MHDEEIQLKEIKVKDLYDVACRFSSNPDKNGVIPINKKRALAHINNPHADAEGSIQLGRVPLGADANAIAAPAHAALEDVTCILLCRNLGD